MNSLIKKKKTKWNNVKNFNNICGTVTKTLKEISDTWQDKQSTYIGDDWNCNKYYLVNRKTG